MTSQEAAEVILREVGHPLTSREVAQSALDRQLVHSAARDPIMSHAQTIEKNIRDGVYNRPELIFVSTTKGRAIGLPEWNGRGGRNEAPPDPVPMRAAVARSSLSVRVPSDLLKDIELAAQAGIASGLDATVVHLIRKGLAQERERLQSALRTRIEQLGTV
jgi:hypothetical protein